MTKEKIAGMSEGHTTWLSSLDFYKEELGSMKTRLTEIAGKYTSKEVASQVEHFENQLLLQSENIDTLKHNINVNLVQTADQAKHNTAGYVDATLIQQHDGQQGSFEGIEKVINDLRPLPRNKYRYI